MAAETSTTLISSALFRMGVIPVEQSVPDVYIQRGVIALNDVIDEWGGSRIYIPYQSSLTLPLVYPTERYTVGLDASYSLNTEQIIEVLECVVNDPGIPGVDYAVTDMTELMYRNIPYKLIYSIPELLLLRNHVNYSELIFQPIPYSALTAKILCKQRLSRVTINQDLDSIPNHYLLALKYNVQAHLAPEFGKVLDDNFQMRLKKVNDNLLASNFSIDWSTKKDETLSRYNTSNYYWWWLG